MRYVSRGRRRRRSGDLTVCATATLTINRYATSLALPITDETLACLADERLPA